MEFDELATGDGAVFWQAPTFDGNDFPTTHIRRVAEGDVAVSTIYQANLATYGDSRGKGVQVDGSTVYLTAGSQRHRPAARFTASRQTAAPSWRPFSPSRCRARDPS